MTAEEYLKQIGLMQEILEEKQSEIKELHKRADGIKAFDFLGTKVSGGKLAGNKGISNMVTRIITEEENYMKLFDLAFKLRAEIVSKIQALKNLLHVRFLFKYYVEGKSLETISNEVRKSYSYIKSIKRKALEDFEKRHSKFLERAKPALQSVL